jgi:hypothetical protein
MPTVLCDEISVNSCELAQGDSSELWLLYSNTKKPESLSSPKFILLKKKCCSSITMPRNTQVCAQLRPSRNTNGQCCCAQHIQSWPRIIRFHLFSALKNSLHEHDYVAEHCRTLCTRGCRGSSVTFTGWGYRFLFKGGRRLLKKTKSIPENKYTFNNTVVKFCEIFKCLTW